MNGLCAFLAGACIVVGIAYSIQREDAEYLVEFIMGALFVILIWIIA